MDIVNCNEEVISISLMMLKQESSGDIYIRCDIESLYHLRSQISRNFSSRRLSVPNRHLLPSHEQSNNPFSLVETIYLAVSSRFSCIRTLNPQ